MPPAVRGSVYWCDYGPIVGAELSSHRPALIISHTKLNNDLSAAITFPMSRTPPPARQVRNHVFVESVRSWVSVRQIKSVHQSRLGKEIGEATPKELEEALQVLSRRLLKSRSGQARGLTPSDYQQVELGMVWDVESQDQDSDVQNDNILILDYNHRNGIAIAVDVEYEQRLESQVRVPISMVGSSDPTSALIHRIRSIDTWVRSMTMINRVDEDSLMLVKSRLLSAVGI